MIRSLKKLKIWSRLKKRRRPATPIQQGPHSGHRCSCSARQATPPLLLSPPLDLTSILTSAAHSGAPASYQQYLAPSPVSGRPSQILLVLLSTLALLKSSPPTLLPYTGVASFAVRGPRGAAAAGTTIRASDMEKLSLEQLRSLKEQSDLEVNLLQDSLTKIRTAAARLENATAALHDLSLRPRGTAASMYISLSLSLDPFPYRSEARPVLSQRREEVAGPAHGVSLCSW
ncbi:hypothetical protein BHE74_00028958 [Ensete ventricosum]|nr:hypothetical protein BHE74_00028958 [Ensete ventricosum]RZS06651.1 hypothetical protein BHM03_00037348 [Ensete ventricosum]